MQTAQIKGHGGNLDGKIEPATSLLKLLKYRVNKLANNHDVLEYAMPEERHFPLKYKP